VHQLSIDFKKAYDSVRREVLCSILIEFGAPMKLLRLIKMCLNEIQFNSVQLYSCSIISITGQALQAR
jgi:hypothetical protein